MKRDCKIAHLVLGVLLPLMVVSCGEDSFEMNSSDVDTSVEVMLPVDGGVATRTALSDDGLTVKWVAGDELLLWADGLTNSKSDFTAEVFQLKYFGSSLSSAHFAGILDSAMEEQQYIYRGFSPVPKTINGDTIIFEISAVQSGEYDGDLDFRVADPVEGGALTESEFDDYLAPLSFRSIMHAFKITIPDGQNDLSDLPIQEIVMTMPLNVVGDMEFDMSTMSNVGTLVDGQPVVSITLSEDSWLREGDGKYAWIFINPTTLSAGSVIKFAAVDTSGKMSRDYELILSEEREFKVAHITPVNLYVPVETTTTSFEITIDKNNLGESINSISFTAASGAVFNESGTNVVTFDVLSESADVYRMSYDTYVYGDKFKASGITVSFDSDQAITTDTINMDDVVDDVINKQSVTVPHLIFEDFDTITSGLSYHDNEGCTSSDTDKTNDCAIYLEDYGLPGWTAARVGTGTSTAITTNKAVRVCSRYESTWGVGDSYHGRLDSPTFGCIKTTANVKVSYNYKGGRYSRYTPFSSWTEGGNGNATYNYGSTADDDSKIKGSVDIENAELSSYVTLPNTAGSNSSSSQNYNDISNSKSYVIEDATASTRASWRVCNTESKGTSRGNFWLYIDSVVVTIVPKSLEID